MKSNAIKVYFSSFFMGTALLAGCSKSGTSPADMEPAKVSMAVSRAFEKSAGETKQAAEICVNSLEKQDAPTAFQELQKMNQKSDLTPEQRAVVTKAMQATFKQLQSAAEQGNASAQAVMNNYLSTR
jgi:hypothetical protein